ncbi:exodeoxyribonuclease III [Helicobacter sp. MIT 14-3879]|uniref:exodeoxyribonuclease III n=1 Tax=Helicobacter sp. MIT 14-3879 TaxID=2040649 RepID=UPI000E1F968B|nr:exodeoxyribonuclease III [Helicobacter sp. MIT 14-3879]RDU63500.1 exodeoxyribonuclease III [Helicobacter sp. MIT 14-3879]
MRLISWNVNGLRACINKGFMDFFNYVDADIFCIQETKMQKEQASFEFNGYYNFWNSAIKKGYSGTLILSKQQPLNESYGINISHHDNEGRVITLEFEKFYLVNVYTPNSQRELTRLNYRMEWEDDFKDFLHSFNKPVIVCGDLNVAHKEIDLKNPKQNTKNAGFTKEEREKFSILLDSGFVDSFRYLYPDKIDAYTWWSYMGNSREKNIGWRIDYFLLSNSIASHLKEADIYNDIYGSDHCPVGINIDL